MSTKRGRYGDPRKRNAAEAGSIPVAIAACRSVDISQLPALDVPVPPPMVDDTIRACARCEQDCWVAPQKLALADQGRAVITCFPCAIVTAGPGAVVVDLNPQRVEQPRR